MKKLNLVSALFLILFSSNAFGQKLTGYYGLGFERVTNSESLNFKSSLVFDKGDKFRVALDFQTMQIETELPEGFEPAWNPLFWTSAQNDKMQVLSLGIGKTTANRRVIKTSLEAGVSMIRYSPAVFEEDGFFLFGMPSHSAIYPETKFSAGFNLKSRTEIKFGKYAGMSINLQGNFNKYHSFFSGGVGFNFGRLK